MAQGFKFVAEEFESHRPRAGERPNVENAAAQGDFTLLRDLGFRFAALLFKPFDQVERTDFIAAGKCARVTVGVEGEGAGVDLRAFDASDDSDLDRGEAAFSASVRVCAGADTGRSVRFEARASAGKVDAVIGEETLGKE